MFYCDTSFLTPLFRAESTSPAVTAFLASQSAGSLATSQLTRIEFASVLARDVRMKDITDRAALDLDDRFNATVATVLTVWLPGTEDYELARRYLRDHATGLRGPDALHLAVAVNNRAEAIYTLDKGMIRAGRRLGLPVTSGIRTSG